MPDEKDAALESSTVRIRNDLLEMMRVVCVHTKGRNGKQLKLSDYLETLLREQVTKDHAGVMRRIAAEQQDPKKRK